MANTVDADNMAHYLDFYCLERYQCWSIGTEGQTDKNQADIIADFYLASRFQDNLHIIDTVDFEKKNIRICLTEFQLKNLIFLTPAYLF